MYVYFSDWFVLGIHIYYLMGEKAIWLRAYLMSLLAAGLFPALDGTSMRTDPSISESTVSQYLMPSSSIIKA